ncbi:MAG: hypothetical protein ACXVBU_08740 [Ktedonobacteraceae bacterium]
MPEREAAHLGGCNSGSSHPPLFPAAAGGKREKWKALKVQGATIEWVRGFSFTPMTYVTKTLLFQLLKRVNYVKHKS